MRLLRRTAVGGAAALVALSAGTIAPSAAGALPANAVAFGAANFSGYASGDEAHVGAVALSGTTSAADLSQAFSGATVNSAGLTSAVSGDNGGSGTGALVQPAQAASVNAYGTGVGLATGLFVAPNGSADQLNLAGKATQIAPPNNAAVTSTLPSAGGLNLPAGLATAGLLTGRGAAIYDSTQCPLGQPISYGLGNAANVDVLNYASVPSTLTGALSPLLSALGIAVPNSGSLVQLDGPATATAQSDSSTYLSPNADGSFGVTTQAEEIIAPVTLNILGIATVTITLSGNQAGTAPANPVALQAIATGEASGAELKLLDDNFITVNLTAGGTTTALVPGVSLATILGQGGLQLDLNPSTLTSQLQTSLGNILSGTALNTLTSGLGTVLGTIGTALAPVTSNLNFSLGTLDIGVPPRAINGAAGTTPTPGPANTVSTTSGTAASGAFDLVRVHVGLSAPTGSPLTPLITAPLNDLADVNVGHLEASANLSAPIDCTIPIVKTANPTSVTAGSTFTYNIQVPDPAKLALIDCSLTNVSATDTITDLTGKPTFSVVSASNGGTVDNVSSTRSVVNWTGLSYTVAPTGSPPNPPINLTITVSVPAGSPSGVITDTVTATGTLSGCQGGVSGSSSVGNADGATLTGTYTLDQPSVTAAGATTPTTVAGTTPTTTAKTLPFTGAIGGPWQPYVGLGALGAGGAALALVRRSRRRA